MTRKTPAGSTLVERLIFHTRRDASGCWLWTAALNNCGYGLVTIPGTSRKRSVHRASYEAFVGPIPEGLTIDHLCNVRHCINPTHLEPVTIGENSRRAWARRRAIRKAAA